MVEVTKLLEIHKYRDKGLTQKAVAERLGSHRNTKNIGTAKTKAILKTYRPKDALPKQGILIIISKSFGKISGINS